MSKKVIKPEVNPAEWMEEMEGQLAIDLYQTEDAVVIQAPIAGVTEADLDISITEDEVTIAGERNQKIQEHGAGYVLQECYWGSFSRSIPLPVEVESEQAVAKLQQGILTITIPTLTKKKAKKISVLASES
jgi:HSP20 family protein